jgi:hypothetical protein
MDEQGRHWSTIDSPCRFKRRQLLARPPKYDGSSSSKLEYYEYDAMSDEHDSRVVSPTCM